MPKAKLDYHALASEVERARLQAIEAQIRDHKQRAKELQTIRHRIMMRIRQRLTDRRRRSA